VEEDRLEVTLRVGIPHLQRDSAVKRQHSPAWQQDRGDEHAEYAKFFEVGDVELVVCRLADDRPYDSRVAFESAARINLVRELSEIWVLLAATD
jgi:hypothetical protein